jgi:hypothetical protein
MAPSLRNFTNNDLGTVLYTALSAVTSGTGDSITLPVNTGLPSAYPFRVLLEWGTSNWEVVSITSLTTFNSSNNTNTYACIRDIDVQGIRTTSPAHSANVSVIQGVSAQDFADANATDVIVGAYSAVGAGYVLVSQASGVPLWQTIPVATVPVTYSAALSAGTLVLVKNTTGSPSTANFLIQSQTAGDKSFGIYVAGDATYRIQSDSNGKLQWASGAAASDVNLYRASAGLLQTDQNLNVSGALTVGGKFTVGGFIAAINTVTTTYTMTTSSNTVLADATTAAFTITLPTPTTGFNVEIVKIDSSAHVVTIVSPSGNINGAASYTALSTQYKGVMLVSDGTNWFTTSQT